MKLKEFDFDYPYEKNEDYIIYEQNGCIHRKNYENGQGNLEYLYELRDLWVKTFMESLNTKYLYEKEKVGTGCHDSCNSFSDAWNKSRSDG